MEEHQDDATDGSAEFGDFDAEEVSDFCEQGSLVDEFADAGAGVEDAGDGARDLVEFFVEGESLVGLFEAGEHLQVPHGVFDGMKGLQDEVFAALAEVADFDGETWFAAGHGGVWTGDGTGGIAGAVAIEDDMAQSGGLGEGEGAGVQFGVADEGRVDMRPKLLIGAAGVHVDEECGSFDDLGGEEMSELFGESAVRATGEHAVQVLAIHGAQGDSPAEESGEIGNMNEHQSAGEIGGLEFGTETVQRKDGWEFIAVNAGGEREDGAGFCTVKDGDRDCGVANGGEERRTATGGNGVAGEGKRL